MLSYLGGARAHAEDSGAQILSFGGFGTLGVVHSSEHNADFTYNIFRPNGAGYSHNWSAAVDSRLGAQVTANPAPRLSAVVQVIAEQNYDNTYRPHVEWANIKYQFTPDFSLRVGRINLPAFLLSDVGKVGFSIPWVRLPPELYGLEPVTNADGVDASYRMHFREFTNTFTFNYSNTDLRRPGDDFVTARDSWGFSDTAERGPVTVRITFQTTRLTVSSFHSLFDAFRQFGPQGDALADKYDEYKTPFQSLGLGASYDAGDWFVMGEWGYADAHSVIGTSTGWYASGGYRLGPFTPYVTYAQVEANSNTSDPGLTVSALPPSLAGPATGLNGALNSILGSTPVQKTISAGARWDFSKRAALKLQYDHSRHGAGSPGTLINLQPGFQTGGQVNLLSAVVDFVF